MADIFFSYSRSDLDRVRPLVEALEERGWSVWWDPDIHGGDSWSDVIEAELKQARCVIVAWSARSAEFGMGQRGGAGRQSVPQARPSAAGPNGSSLRLWRPPDARPFRVGGGAISSRRVPAIVPLYSNEIGGKCSSRLIRAVRRESLNASRREARPCSGETGLADDNAEPKQTTERTSRTEMVLIVLGVTSLTGIGWYGSSKMSDRSIDKPSAGRPRHS